MTTRNWIEAGASLLGGAGIGAAAMYLFDPELGEKRRRDAAARPQAAANSTSGALGNTWEAVSEGARGVTRNLAEGAEHWAASAADAASRARSRAMGYADDVADGANAYGRGLSKSAQAYAKKARAESANWFGTPAGQGTAVVAAEVIAGAAGALVVGAGLMYLLDPAQGRRRRAYLRDKTVSAARHTGDFVASQSRHLGNKAQGVAAKAKHLAGAVTEKVTGGAAAESEQTSQPA